MIGKLIVFEGVEGSGKTTLLNRCYQWLKEKNYPVVATLQPGGTELGCYLRRLLLLKDNIVALAELFLYCADRAQHVEEFIKPHLAKGSIILCDRFIYSTLAYQGYGRSLSVPQISLLNEIASDGLKPDITLWLDVEPETGLLRKKDSQLDRIEAEEIDFHRRVQQGYQELAASDPAIYRVDASVTAEEVFKEATLLIEQVCLEQKSTPV